MSVNILVLTLQILILLCREASSLGELEDDGFYLPEPVFESVMAPPPTTTQVGKLLHLIISLNSGQSLGIL